MNMNMAYTTASSSEGRSEDQKMMAVKNEEWRDKTRSASSKHALSSFELSLVLTYGLWELLRVHHGAICQ